MKPYIEFNGEKIYLPQRVDPYKFEVCSRSNGAQTFFLLCRKVGKRYRQATGVVLKHNGTELDFYFDGSYVQKTFPLEGSEFSEIRIDWNVGGPVSIKHEE